MKKRTVITTEKREVWVIRQAGNETEPSNDESSPLHSMIPLLEQNTGTELSPEKTDKPEKVENTRTAYVQ